MKKIIYILLMIFIPVVGAFSQVENVEAGRINNKGTIRIKSGTFVPGMQDTIGGRVAFLSKPVQSQQSIPNIVYDQLEVANKSTKLLGSLKDATGKTKPMVVRDSLIIRDTANLTTNWVGLDAEDVIAKGHLKNDARFSGQKKIIIAGDTAAQDMLGKGAFSNLEINNPFGVNIKDGGGFTVEDTLILRSGQVRNSAENNFKVADSVKIIRYADASVNHTLEFDKNANVRYVGDGGLVYSGGELPDSANVLQELSVENSGGLVLTKNVQVNKRLYLNTRLCTEFDSVRKFVLTYTPALNPDFGENPLAEIEGTFRRTGLLFDSTSMLFNNKFTWALFRNSIDSTITALNFRIKPREFFKSIPGASENKVKRTIEIWAENPTENDTVRLASSVDLGYAWRNDNIIDSLNETRGLTPDALKLVHWNQELEAWQQISTSSVPQLSEDGNWYTANATNVDLLGKFVIGMASGDLYLTARVYLEGAYFADSIMSNDLYTYNLLQVTPRPEYPYNLDPNREFVKSKLASMDSIVDWVVLEFKKANIGSYYITALLKKDGTIISPEGTERINLSKAQIDSGDYYIGVLHRNHLPVYTINKFRITAENNGQLADFTQSKNVYGKEGSLKLLDMTGGFLLYGMVAGDVNGDNIINETDYRITWEARDLEYKWSRYDINLSGYVNTKDINFPWNNRNRSANIPLP